MRSALVDPGAAPSEAAPSTGNGLIGVQERARLLGGDARWGRVEENPDMFEVEAEIPW